MFARFDENPAMTLQDIEETKRYGRTDGSTDNVKTVYPPQTKFAEGIKTSTCDPFKWEIPYLIVSICMGKSGRQDKFIVFISPEEELF